ncbi:MAG: glycosyltransferase [Eubacterium sp.]|jgi:glycosyltransferase involved in cell wall biosynthesis|nr:glycosyltransferase [Eubacterium sp.]
MKEIYICHQYFDKSHFGAIYKCAKQNGYEVKDYIVLEKKHIINRMGKQILYEHKYAVAIKEFVNSLVKIQKFKKLKNKIVIVGLAPYDYLLNKYKNVFKNNHSIYFTSWQFWNGSIFPRGNLKNRKNFELALKNSFIAAACVSKISEQQIKNFIPKTAVVNHSIPVKEYRKKSTETIHKNKYLFLGRLAPVKNISFILEYMKENPSSNIQVDFAGQGVQLPEVQSAVNTDSRIHYLGRLSKKEIKECLCEYKYLLLPSQEEPFGIVLLEAFAAGVPCIVSNALGPDEIIDNLITGLKFDLKDGFKGFTAVMNHSQLLSEDTYNIMVQNCLKESERYSEEIIFEKWKTIL